MKKIFPIIILFLCILSKQVNAKETNYYINSYHVEFTKEEYDYFSTMFYEGYQETITQEELELYPKEYRKKELVITQYLEEIVPIAANLETEYKSFKITKSGVGQINIGVTLEWKKAPKNRSYDVMGAYFEGVNREGEIVTKLNYNGGSYTSNELKNWNHGFGISIKLPSNGTNIKLTQSYKTSSGGTIYASYQHSTSTISLADSKNYTIGKNGLGNVFIFSNGLGSKFEAMRGISINV